MAPHSNTLLLGKSHGQRSLAGFSPWGPKSRTWLSDFTFTFHFHALEKAMATHSSVLAWRIPGMGEPGGLPSRGLHRVRYDWSDLAAAAAFKHFWSLLLLFSRRVLSNSSVIPWTIVHQAPLSKGFSRQEYWNGLSFPPPEDLLQRIFPTQGSNMGLLH